MRVAIYVDDNRGYVHYNPSSKEVMVSSEIDKVRWAVYRYLTSEHTFTLSGSDNVGDKRDITVVPTEKSCYIELALCQMYFNIGVHVDWGDPDNEGDHEELPEMVKSLDGSCVYNIIK